MQGELKNEHIVNGINSITRIKMCQSGQHYVRINFFIAII